LKDLSTEELLAQRYEKYLAMGHFKD
ncbi:MAG: hypothetical protein RL311_1369, partial [Bacteroidota bacterium]|jgi:acetyl-CoA carboxylase alpha subunit